MKHLSLVIGTSLYIMNQFSQSFAPLHAWLDDQSRGKGYPHLGTRGRHVEFSILERNLLRIFLCLANFMSVFAVASKSYMFCYKPVYGNMVWHCLTYDTPSIIVRWYCWCDAIGYGLNTRNATYLFVGDEPICIFRSVGTADVMQ